MGTQKNRLSETYVKIDGKKILTFLRRQFCLSKPVVKYVQVFFITALMRDDSNNPNLSASVKPMISVYTSAGKLVNTLRVGVTHDFSVCIGRKTGQHTQGKCSL